jgi:hypothetical protein
MAKDDGLFTIDDFQIIAFYRELQRYGKSNAFRKECAKFLEACGLDLLRIVGDEIIRREVVDTRLLLASFTKGNKNNVWEASHDGLTLTVGTNVEYASYVNDGHWTNPKGVYVRWVPGYWQGNIGPGGMNSRFVYDPGAKTGMLLKQHWVEGKHYWEAAIRIFDSIFPKILMRKMQEWMATFAQQAKKGAT